MIVKLDGSTFESLGVEFCHPTVNENGFLEEHHSRYMKKIQIYELLDIS